MAIIPNVLDILLHPLVCTGARREGFWRLPRAAAALVKNTSVALCSRHGNALEAEQQAHLQGSFPGSSGMRERRSRARDLATLSRPPEDTRPASRGDLSTPPGSAALQESSVGMGAGMCCGYLTGGGLLASRRGSPAAPVNGRRRSAHRLCTAQCSLDFPVAGRRLGRPNEGGGSRHHGAGHAAQWSRGRRRMGVHGRAPAER